MNLEQLIYARRRQPNLWAWLNSDTGFRGEGSETFARVDPQWEFIGGTLTEYASGVPAFGDNGFAGAPARANKCTNYNANPNSGAVAPTDAATFNAATTNLTASGGDGSTTWGVVDDSSALAAAGLDGICSADIVLDIDNTGGAADAYINYTGTTGNTNAHSLSIWGRRVAGSNDGILGLSAGEGDTNFSNAAYERVNSENVTPGATTRSLLITAQAGAHIRVCLNQLEEGAFSTSEIVTEGSFVTRNATDLSYPVANNHPVNNYDYSLDVTFKAAGQGTVNIVGSYSDASNYVSVFNDGSTTTFRTRIAGVNYDATIAHTPVAGTTYNIKIQADDALGKQIWLDNVAGTSDADTTDAVLGTDWYIGNDGNSASYIYAEFKDTKIFK